MYRHHLSFAIYATAAVVALTGAAYPASKTKELLEPCSLSEAVYESGEYSVRFGKSQDCADLEGVICPYTFSIKLQGPGITVLGSSIIPNGFARQFYTMDFPNHQKEEPVSMGGFYFITTNERGDVLPTDGGASLKEAAPPAVVLPELSRQLYYTQRDHVDDLVLPTSDIFVFSRCTKGN